jgi:NADPH:quinone reductase-like Zn-dependent oxidoreductase
MRALVMTRYGGPSVVELRDVPVPTPGPRELLVEVHAASINPVDIKIREGQLRLVLPLRFPHVLGNDLSGIVVAVGKDVTSFAPGDRVHGRTDKRRMGAFAEMAVIDERFAARVPAGLPHVEAASLPLAGLTAWQAMHDRMNLRPGDRVLVHAGAGGVGTLAIQIARAAGFLVVTTSREKNHAFLRELGASELIDYTKHRFENETALCDGVLDAVGGDTLMRSSKITKPGGVVVGIVGPPTPAFARELGAGVFLRLAMGIVSARVRLAAWRRRARYEFLFMRPSGEQLAALDALVASGHVRPVIDRATPLDDAKAAFEHVANGRARGKVVLVFRRDPVG